LNELSLIKFPDANDNVFRESPVDAEMAVQNGYTESKWISEEILIKAAKSTPARPLIIRVGQLSGGINGAWNISEWVPALVQSAQFIRCIPDDSRVRAIRAS
jgi:thioester reductase-like protein